MKSSARPAQVTLFALLFLLAAVFMVFVGTMAGGYYVCAITLAMQAALLWQGRAFKLFECVLVANQLTGLALVLVLWLGDGLGAHLAKLKLDISGVMLLANLVLGGPLMAIMALLVLGTLHFSKTLPSWFQAKAA